MEQMRLPKKIEMPDINYEKLKLMSKEEQANEVEKHKICYDELIKKLELNRESITYLDKEYLFRYSASKNELLQKYPEHFKDFHYLDLYTEFRRTSKSKQQVYVDTTEYSIDKLEYIENFYNNLNLDELWPFYDDFKNNVIIGNHGNKDKSASVIQKEVKNEFDKFTHDLKKSSLNILIDVEKNLTIDNFLTSEYALLVLHSKWIAILTDKIIESYGNNKKYYELKLNNTEIRFTVKTLIHILFRHYSSISKIAENSKDELECSHFEENWHYEAIYKNLEKIFIDIDGSNILKNNFVANLVVSTKKENHLTFEFENQIYRIFISKNKSESESGNNSFYEISTFHPLKNQIKVNFLFSNYKKIKVNNHLQLFVKS